MQTATKTSILITCLFAAGIFVKPAQAQTEKNGFTIEGSIKDMSNPPAFVYLVHYKGDPRATDSAPVIKGRYVIKNSTEEVNPVRISSIYTDNEVRGNRQPVPVSNVNYVTVYANKGDKIQIASTGTMGNAVVTGSETDQDFHEANKLVELFGDTLKKTYQMAKETNNQVLLSSILTMGNMEKIGKYTKDGFFSFIRKKPASPVNLYLLKYLIEWKEQAGLMQTLNDLYKLLPVATRSSGAGKDLGNQLAAELKIAPGKKAMDFTQPNSQGQPVKLSSFKGKYVLVHFWASWDDNNSNMLELINKACQTFQAKGLTAVGVSLDADKESWLQVISEKKIENIINVSDLKGRKNEAASLYGIRKLPDNLLIDPNGIIVARNLTGFTLDKTLTSIFE